MLVSQGLHHARRPQRNGSATTLSSGSRAIAARSRSPSSRQRMLLFGCGLVDISQCYRRQTRTRSPRRAPKKTTDTLQFWFTPVGRGPAVKVSLALIILARAAGPTRWSGARRRHLPSASPSIPLPIEIGTSFGGVYPSPIRGRT